MKKNAPLRLALAASLALAALSGCVVSPTGSQAGPALTTVGTTTTPAVATTKTGAATTTTPAKAAATAFTNKAATAAVNSSTAVTSAATAKALAVNDESLMESASAAMEEDEVAAQYALASAPEAAGRGASQFMAMGFLGGERVSGMRRGEPAYEAPPPPPQARGGRQQPIAQPVIIARGRTQIQVNVTVNINLNDARLNERRQQAKKQQASFVKENPKYGEEVEAIRKVLDAQPWQPNADDPDTVFKSGTSSLTLGTGATRKVSVLRVVTKKKPHHLVHGVTDLAEKKADGSEKVIHWEKALQADGSFDIAYHHESTNAAGARWVTDWTKTLNADGTIAGKGTFSSYDADGGLISEEVLTIGGTDANGQTITDDDEDEAADDTAATDETATEETATDDAAATEETATEDETATEEEAAADASATTEAAEDEAAVSTEG